MNDINDWKGMALKWELLATVALADVQEWKYRAREYREEADRLSSKVVGLQVELGKAEALTTQLADALAAIPTDCGHEWNHTLACWCCKARAALAKVPR